MNVAFVTADTGGCRHYRCRLPARELEQHEHKTVVAQDLGINERTGELLAYMGSEYLSGFDVVVLQRWMRADASKVIARARALGQVVINDVDDWFDGLPAAHRAFLDTHPALDSKQNRDHYRRALAASSALTVSTPYLAERLERLGRPVYVLRNLIDTSAWQLATTSLTDEPVLGWVGAIAYRSPGDLMILRGIVGPFLDQRPGSRFVHIGDRDPLDFHDLAQAIDIPAHRIESRAFVGIDHLPAAMEDVDVALAPLERCPFNLAKSAVKAMEASAAGIPFIASALPEYEWFSDGRAGIVADSPAKWRNALEYVCDPVEREHLSTAGRARVEECDIRLGWQAWERAYTDALRIAA
jgi:glycosyltransferase involved in cell wall biosynthesis